jgi:hypothetical protein
MKSINKQQAGFKFGKFRLEVLETFGEISHNGRTYRLLKVRTNDNLEYLSLRLYNGSGKFIKQMLIEPELAEAIIHLFCKATGEY